MWSAKNLTPFQITNILRCETHSYISYNNGCNICDSLLQEQFRSYDDPVKSALSKIELSSSVEWNCSRESPLGVGVGEMIEKLIVDDFNVSKLLISQFLKDSSFQTNRKKIELFEITESVLGAGFPSPYLLLEVGRENSSISSETALKSFPQAVSNVLLQMRSDFFFMDKERNQINFTQNWFLMTPSSVCGI